MKKLAIIGLACALFAGTALLEAQDAKKEPAKEYRVLHQLVGEWEYDSEAVLEPGKPPVKAKGSASARAVGDLWVVIETKGTVLDMPFTGVMTLGYDAGTKKHVGTWIDSMNSHLVIYDGALDEAGKVLTLLTEAPNPTTGKRSKFKDAIEIKGKGQHTLTSSIQMENGKWVTFLTVNYRRKK